MSQPHPAFAANGHTVNGRSHGGHTVDWNGYPALFQRVAPAAERTPQRPRVVEFVTERESGLGQAGGARDAFLGFCQAALFPSGMSYRNDRWADSVAAARAIAAAETFGFTRDEIRRLGCGLYVGPAEVREHLRALGFSEADIDAARLTCDETGRPRTELAGCFVVPLTDETGRLCDFLFLTAGEPGRGFGGYRYLYGPARSEIVAFGLRTALSRPESRRSLVLVEDVLEGLLLQCRGLECVAAVGGAGHDLSPRRWEELARLGVTTVTLAFRRDERHAASVRDALVGALRARTAPEVCVANPYPGGERSAADVLRRLGPETCRRALEARTLAFHDKDFGADRRVHPTAEPSATWVASASLPQPTTVPAAPYHRTAYRKHLADLVSTLPIEERAAAEDAIDAVGQAIAIGDYPRATWMTEGSLPPATPAPTEWFWATWAGGYAVPRNHRDMAPEPAPPSSAVSPREEMPSIGWFVTAVPAVPTAWPTTLSTVPAPRSFAQSENGRVVLSVLRDWIRCERSADRS